MRTRRTWITRSGWMLPALLALALPARTAPREGPGETRSVPHFERHAPPASDRFLPTARPQRVTASPTATILAAWDFEHPSAPDPQGWTTHDLTEEPTYFHVADAGELDGGDYGRLVPLRGSKSLWCGLPAGAGFPVCGWAEPPGYGNNWNQVWKTKNCVDLAENGAISYVFSTDSEPGYDALSVEVTACGADNWVVIDGGVGVFDGIIVDSTHTTTIPPAFDSSFVEIRFRFESDGAGSDEDGFIFDGDGAVLMDDVIVTDVTGVLVPLEGFDDSPTGINQTSYWWARPPQQPFYNYAALFYGDNVLDEDVCRSNVTTLWGFFQSSSYDYSCGGHPEQLAVPYGDATTGYIHNEVWSPWVEWTGAGDAAYLEFDVYRDLAPENNVFYTWRIRSMAGGCPTHWVDRSLSGPGAIPHLYYGDGKDWYRHRDDFGDLVDPAATHIQIALGVIDVPGYNFNPSPCHSHAPLFDNVVVYRDTESGPRWHVRDIDLFQDTFPRDGSLTGTGRADMAQDPVHGPLDPEYFPGDSAFVQSCTDIVNGIPQVSGAPYEHRAVYCYVSVAPPDTGKAGVHLENTNLLGGQPRFAYRGMVSAAGMAWTQMNCDRRRDAAGTVLSETQFCIDLPDNLFEAGDTIFYFFGAQNTIGEWSYWTREAGTVYSIEEAAALPLEFQILPSGGDPVILYVDGMDGLGAQPYFDTAFEQIGWDVYVDRFDVNAPSSAASNRLGTRVYDIQQLATPYRVIVWNTGDLPVTIGDGTSPDKCNDWLVLDAWMTALQDAEVLGLLYLNGDDLPSAWAAQTGASALAMGAWLDYDVPPGGNDHAPLVGTSPYGVGVVVAGSPYGDPATHPYGPDTLVVFGGCGGVHDFDYVTAQGSAMVYMTYEGMGASAGAVVGQRTAAGDADVGVLLSGFSFHSIRDDRLGYAMDRSVHLRFTLRWNGAGPEAGPIVGAGDGPGYANTLAQNYPNPFNPVTTIAFTVKERTPVRLRVYDVKGALVRTLVDDIRAPGITHTVTWDGRNQAGQSVASGVYFYRLVAKDFTQTRKMVVLK